MDKSHQKSSSNHNRLITLEEIGNSLSICSTGEKMRLVVCPECNKHFIFKYLEDVEFAECICGLYFQIMKRWFE